jgi:ATP-binding cassette subfamily F protein 3
VLDAQGLGAARAGRQLFSDLDLLVRRGDRIGIVGPNGCGKSTLLRLLSGQGAPSDHGNVKRGTNLRDGFFDQHLGTLRDDASGLEEIQGIRGDLNVDATRQYLARFRFYGDDPFRKIASLSGGERTRLALAKLLLEPRNLLLLDEPTNHLDIIATEILEQALVDFDGTVILVSHDRRFLETVTTRSVSFEPSGTVVYEGGFADYVESLERRARAEREVSERASAESTAKGRRGRGASPSPLAAPAGADEHRARRAQARELERKEKRLKELEDLVAAGERELGTLRQRLNEAEGGNWAELHEWANKERSLTERVEKMMSEWLNLSEELAKIAAAAGGEP